MWVSTDGDDRLRPYIDRYVQEGILEWVSDKSLALVEQARPTDGAEQSPPLELYDEDFALLNLLEDQEKKRINFGIFESWTTLRSLGAELGWDQISMAAAAERLRANGYVLIGDDDRCRSRMAELAREVRYVKQRFRVDDAHQRPYLVRSLKLATRGPQQASPRSLPEHISATDEGRRHRRAISGPRPRSRERDAAPRLALK